MQRVKERFIKYVKYDTQSKMDMPECPSTQGQLDFAKALAEECRRIGLEEVKLNDMAYITASIPSTVSADAPVVGFIAHLDTSPDSSGKNVNPTVHMNYGGGSIELKPGMLLSPSEFPELSGYLGQDIVTTDGTTLLGADDKAGIAEIMTAAEYLIQNPEVEHGKIMIGFTPDEEVGRGGIYFNVEEFGANFAYTLDGGEIGELEAENFNAARATFKITGKSVHTGSAKGIMKNAALIAVELAQEMPYNETPALTEGYDGFFHLVSIEGIVESAKLVYLIRDFDVEGFRARKESMTELAESIGRKYGHESISLEMHDEYYNMADSLKGHELVIDLACRAMDDAGVKPKRKAIRGGTDGAMLSQKGLACPNLFTGGHNFHGPYEYIPLQSMEKAVEVIINICKGAARVN
ncbi:MAG: peptidase T [Clostridiales bacterium]|nr:peptidase T [Clostridiales bacterium]